MSYMESMAGTLRVKRLDSRAEMGECAARDAAACIRQMARQKDALNIIFAAAPSQNEFLDALCHQPDLPWAQINAFQLDDYVGIREDAPQRFANYLKRSIFDRVPLRSCELFRCGVDVKAEIIRYSALLRSHPLDIAFIGIGENGHIAFNDPDTADFFDPDDIKRVTLAEASRLQQVNDACFESLKEVPLEALTVTIPVILRARQVFCVVPSLAKAQAIHETIMGEISSSCPASALRLHKNATLYLDLEAAATL